MASLQISGAPVYIGDIEPILIPNSGYSSNDWKWWNTTKHKWYIYNGVWSPVEGDNTGDTNFTGTVLVNGVSGVSVNFDCEISGVKYRIKKLEVDKGIVTKLVVEEDV